MLLLLVSCGKEERKDENKDTTQNSLKIQKNNSFEATCESITSDLCSTGNPACGTKLGEGVLKVYCIDDKDTILFISPKCSNEQETPSCELIGKTTE